MKFISLIIAVFFSIASNSQASMWEGDQEYTSYVISADAGADVVFRFSGPGYYTPCDTGAEFTAANLILLVDQPHFREYFLNPETNATGDSGLCVGNAAIPTVLYSEVVKSEWKRVPAGDAVSIIMSTDYEIEIKP